MAKMYIVKRFMVEKKNILTIWCIDGTSYKIAASRQEDASLDNVCDGEVGVALKKALSGWR